MKSEMFFLTPTDDLQFSCGFLDEEEMPLVKGRWNKLVFQVKLCRFFKMLTFNPNCLWLKDLF
jgi:hypothetical protein